MNDRHVLVTLRDGQQVLVDVWPSGTVEIAYRQEAGDVWTPAEMCGLAVEDAA